MAGSDGGTSTAPAGLTLPFVTEADPDTQQEGSLDPLGLFALADRLADEIAPEVTARMSRVRFATAIAACSCVLGEPLEPLGGDGTPGYLAFEWLVVEACVRRPPAGGTEAVPGILKARARLRTAGAHLGPSSYLLVPKVFGFHGIYKRLARDLELVDDALGLLPHGEQLLWTWEAEQGLAGFVRGRDGAGARLARKLREEVQRALAAGGVRMPGGSRYWEAIAAAFAPGTAGARECALLWERLTDARRPLRSELLRALARQPPAMRSERDALERLQAERISPDLRLRLDAIARFEALACTLDDAFQAVRARTTQALGSPVAERALGGEPAVRAAADTLPARFAAAVAALDPLERSAQLELLLGPFAEPVDGAELVRRVLDRHERVQRAKGKRAWFERDERGVAVRPIAARRDAFEPRREYLHPYRLRALRTFARDLLPERA